MHTARIKTSRARSPEEQDWNQPTGSSAVLLDHSVCAVHRAAWREKYEVKTLLIPTDALNHFYFMFPTDLQLQTCWTRRSWRCFISNFKPLQKPTNKPRVELKLEFQIIGNYTLFSHFEHICICDNNPEPFSQNLTILLEWTSCILLQSNSTKLLSFPPL